MNHVISMDTNVYCGYGISKASLAPHKFACAPRYYRLQEISKYQLTVSTITSITIFIQNLERNHVLWAIFIPLYEFILFEFCKERRLLPYDALLCRAESISSTYCFNLICTLSIQNVKTRSTNCAGGWVGPRVGMEKNLLPLQEP
jgi:hypothetical protein